MCHIIQKGCNIQIVKCNHRKVWDRFVCEIMKNDGNVVIVFMPEVVRKRLIKEFEERGETKNSLIDLYPIRRVEYNDDEEKVWNTVQKSYGNKLIIWCDTVEALNSVFRYYIGSLITTEKMYEKFLKWIAKDGSRFLSGVNYIPSFKNIKFLNKL